MLASERHALLLSHLGIAAGRFLHTMAEGYTVVVRTRAQDEERATAIMWQHTHKDFSLADAISFAVMERLGIAQAHTFGGHFAQYGFTPLAPELV